MLTDAQYRALKAWPESGGYVYGVRRSTCEALERQGLMKEIGYTWYYKKIEPACTEAIREYEEAHK